MQVHYYPDLEVGAVFPVTPVQGQADQMTPLMALRLVYHCAAHALKWVTNYPLTALVHLHVAVAKQGNITTKFISKVRNGISSDLQVNLEISPVAVRLFWNAFRMGITEVTAPMIFRVWEA